MDLGAPSLPRTQLISRSVLRSMAAHSGFPPCQTPAVFWHVLSTESASTRLDAPLGRAESSRVEFANCRSRLQCWSRGLFNPLDHPLCKAGSEGCAVRGGHFKGTSRFCRKGYL